MLAGRLADAVPRFGCRVAYGAAIQVPPAATFAEVRSNVERLLLGAAIRRLLLFRYLVMWRA
ncbi:hypothetical protein DAH56_20195 [Sphingomonas koreensis]|nr:hypothetical protein DAH56_20195 [Sphingomonas koreensis]